LNALDAEPDVLCLVDRGRMDFGRWLRAAQARGVARAMIAAQSTPRGRVP